MVLDQVDITIKKEGVCMVNVKNIKTADVQLTVSEGMARYLKNLGKEYSFERDAMLLYPFIQNLTISHGKAAEILGVNK